jgi:hypothetical protein
MMTFEVPLRACTYNQYEDEKWVVIDKDGRSIYLPSERVFIAKFLSYTEKKS